MPVVPSASPSPFVNSRSELEILLGRTFTATEAASADLVLAMATEEVRSITGQTISYVAGDILTLDPPLGARLFLPQLPVTAVASVVVAGTTLTLGSPSITGGYYWYRDTGIITYGSWGYTPQSVVVTYSHGYATIPGVIRDVTLELAAMKLGYYKSGDGAWVKSEMIGNYSVTNQDAPMTAHDVIGGRLDRSRTRRPTPTPMATPPSAPPRRRPTPACCSRSSRPRPVAGR